MGRGLGGYGIREKVIRWVWDKVRKGKKETKK